MSPEEPLSPALPPGSGRRSAYDIADEAITVLWRMEFGGYRKHVRDMDQLTVPVPHIFKATEFVIVQRGVPIAVCACGRVEADHAR